MSEETSISGQAVESVYLRLKKDAEAGGYFLNPDSDFTKELIRGLLANGKRYGYWACPCRLADGVREKDLDIICPCDYRDPDLAQYGACYCGLYVSQQIYNGAEKAKSIPERRPALERRGEAKPAAQPYSPAGKLAYPVWRCKVCGYLAARNEPPEICPVCKVKKDRFERFM